MRCIYFEYWVMEDGFFLELKLPFTPKNLAAVRAMPNTRNIKVDAWKI